MARLQFAGQSTVLRPGETVLDGLLRGGGRVPHFCRAGACRSCLMRAVRGKPPEASQAGLNDALKAQGYFLGCMARPSDDLVVDLGGAGLQRTRVTIASVERLSESVVKVLLEPETPFEYRAGQFLTLLRDDGLSRSYSIASLPGRDRHLELHVRVFAAGRMSRWLAEEARPGETATVQGPSGECFYVPGKANQELVLAGTGTGLAPLYGILRDAVHNGHSAPVTLLHGALNPDGLYLVESLRALERQISWFRYVPCALKGGEGGDSGIEVGALDAILLDRFPSFVGRRVYLCGDPALVQSLRKKVFLKGAGMKEIFCDAFLAAPAAAN